MLLVYLDGCSNGSVENTLFGVPNREPADLRVGT